MHKPEPGETYLTLVVSYCHFCLYYRQKYFKHFLKIFGRDLQSTVSQEMNEISLLSLIKIDLGQYQIDSIKLWITLPTRNI